MRTFKVLGGPGCGKTTEILKRLGRKFREGLLPSQVLMIGFAKATVENLQERAIEELNFTEAQAESIQTIHKYCLDRLPIKNVFTSEYKRDFKNKLKIDESNWKFIDGELSNDAEDCVGWSDIEDKKLGVIFRLIGLARHSMCHDIEDIIKYYNESENYEFSKLKKADIEWAHTNLTNYKKQNFLVDFEDMLFKALPNTVKFGEYKMVMVDEVQDLTDLEWAVIKKLASNTEELHLVGDDDQAIYGWKGARVTTFQKWLCNKEDITILKKTHRLPQNIHHFVTTELIPEISNRMGNYYEVVKKDPGKIYTTSNLDGLSKRIKESTSIMFCGRTNAACRPYVEFLKEEGIPWEQKIRGGKSQGFQSSINPDDINSIKNWHVLKTGGSISGKEVVKLFDRLKDGLIKKGKKTFLTNKDTCPKEFTEKDRTFGYVELKERYYLLADIDKSWHDCLTFETTRKKSRDKPNALFDDDLDYTEYVKSCWDKNRNLKSNILVATVHGVKGMERDVVILSWDWGGSLNSFRNGTEEQEDEEVRTCYVGATRAKKTLIIYQPPKANIFPLLNVEYEQL
tara:strand:+ start:1631 stop:3337 length:1707 start_codon:yes stop_codon:yes gene_type:complete